jgi:ABC-type Fe3+/spermidine/putrescine transport system ATPase subunit
VYLRPRTRFVAGFVGILNTLPATRSGGRVEPGGLSSAGPDGPVEIGFRPESVRFAASGIPATVERSVYRGSFTRHHVRAAGRSLVVDSREPITPFLQVGDAWVLGD